MNKSMFMSVICGVLALCTLQISADIITFKNATHNRVEIELKAIGIPSERKDDGLDYKGSKAKDITLEPLLLEKSKEESGDEVRLTKTFYLAPQKRQKATQETIYDWEKYNLTNLEVHVKMLFSDIEPIEKSFKELSGTYIIELKNNKQLDVVAEVKK